MKDKHEVDDDTVIIAPSISERLVKRDLERLKENTRQLKELARLTKE